MEGFLRTLPRRGLTLPRRGNVGPSVGQGFEPARPWANVNPRRANVAPRATFARANVGPRVWGNVVRVNVAFGRGNVNPPGANVGAARGNVRRSGQRSPVSAANSPSIQCHQSLDNMDVRNATKFTTIWMYVTPPNSRQYGCT